VSERDDPGADRGEAKGGPPGKGEERLYRALRVFLDSMDGANSAQGADSLLARHPELRDELEPLVKRAAGDEPFAATRAMAPAPGAVIGDYRLVRKLGEGGMGVVFEAEQLSLRRPVALKLLLGGAASSARRRARFRREAEAGSRIRHRWIVTVHAIGEENGLPYIAQELVEDGQSLADWISRRRKLGRIDTQWVRKIAGYFAAASRAAAAAHEADVIHRDLKPRNLLVTRSFEPKVADFGLAFMREGLDISQTGDQIGTPHYMSPEQVDPRRGVVDARSDVFALGAALYEALTLRRAFDGASQAEIFRAILDEDPSDPHRVAPAVPRDLAAICLKALEKDPQRRYPTMSDFASDLDRFLSDEPVTARAPSVVDRVLRLARRHKALFGALLLAALLAAAAIQARVDGDRLDRERRAALEEASALLAERLRDPDVLASDTRFMAVASRAAERVTDRLGGEPALAAALLDALAAAAIARERGVDDRKLAIESLVEAAQRSFPHEPVPALARARRAANLAEDAGDRTLAREMRTRWIERAEGKVAPRLLAALELERKLGDDRAGRAPQDGDASAARAALLAEARELLAAPKSSAATSEAIVTGVVSRVLLALGDAAGCASLLRDEAVNPSAASGAFADHDRITRESLLGVAAARSGDFATGLLASRAALADRRAVFGVDSVPFALATLAVCEAQFRALDLLGIPETLDSALIDLESAGRGLSDAALAARHLRAEARLALAARGSPADREHFTGLAVADLEQVVESLRRVRGAAHPEAVATAEALAAARSTLGGVPSTNR
jgi:hypothetical protein